MIQKKNCALILSALMLTACGGGGGGGGAPSLVRTTITGTATPPTAPASGLATASASVVLPAFSSGTWPSIVQSADYTMVNTAPLPGAMPVFKATSMNVRQVDTQTGSTSIATDAAYAFEPTLGQTLAIANTLGGNFYGIGPTAQTPIPGVLTLNGFATGLDTVNLYAPVGTTTYLTAEYALPKSGLLSPVGYTYQTFGYWASVDATALTATEFYFSAGAPTVTTLPTGGTASYTGHVFGSYVNADTRDLAEVRATMNAIADFAVSTVAFNTTGTTTLLLGGTPTANPGLDMSGTLSYATGSNTFTGAVATANGMNGNATGRFYGPGIAAATATKVAGAPPEIGGTFAVMGTGGAMQGAFGGK